MRFIINEYKFLLRIFFVYEMDILEIFFYKFEVLSL